MQDGALYLVRHGATAHNATGDERLRGWADLPLATPGVIAARHAARALAPLGATRLYSSDLRRALDTAKIMSVTLGLTPLRTRELRPWDLGDLTGQRIAEVLPQLEAYTSTKRTVPLPGASESFAAFLSRINATIVKLLQLARRTGEGVIAVTHARTLYALEELLFGHDIPVKGPPHPGAVVRLAGPQGAVSMTLLYAGLPHDTGAS